jgi:fatty-acyl-CoA synthase
VVLPVVPMFHANAWGYPYLATMFGTKIVYPGPHLDPESLLEDFVQEGVTWAAGVPTIWLGILATLDANPGRWDLSRMKGMLVGGSAVPRSMIEAFDERHGLAIVHGWGMTETSPVASTAALPGDLAEADAQTRYDYIAFQGLPLPLVELRARDAEGNEIPWDDVAMGELEVRGPWVAASYYDTPEQADRWTNVIKSGGEWISSVALENALMGHPAIAEAAVIAVPDDKWDERPLAVCALREGQTTSADELREFLAPDFTKWWLPDAFVFVDEIPKTAVGKFRKTALREMFPTAPAGTAHEPAAP